MKRLHLMMTLLLSLPLIARAEAQQDTTVVYQGRHYVLSEDSTGAKVTVLRSDSTQLVKLRETTFVDQQEVERIYISSPFFNLGDHRYMPTTPRFYLGFAGMSGLSASFFHSYELGVPLMDAGFWLDKQPKHQWSLSLIIDLTYTRMSLKPDRVLFKDPNGKGYIDNQQVESSHFSMFGSRTKLMAKWYKYFDDPDNDRLSIGLGLSYDGHDNKENFSHYEQDDYVYAAAAGLKTRNTLSVCGQISYNGLILYGQYAVTPLFKSGFGPSCHPFSIGIGVSF